MRKLLLIGGAAALIALPAAALAETAEPVPETDPIAEDAAGATTTTDKALRVEGRGKFRYEGSGGVVLTGREVVRVTDLSAGKDLVKTPTGFGEMKVSDDGLTTRYRGEGTLTLDGSSYRVTIRGRFTAEVDPTATHPANGTARVDGRGDTILKGGIPVPFWAGRKILLTTGPMSVDLSGRGVPLWRVDTHGPTPKRSQAERGGRSGERGRGATWRLNGPADGAVDLTTVTGRVRVWDRSVAKNLAVTVPSGTTTTTLSDGSIVYSGLQGAKVTLAGSGFRMKVRATDIEGTFTPTFGTWARSFVHGTGSFAAGGVTDLKPGRHGGGVRVLLQPVAPVTPAP